MPPTMWRSVQPISIPDGRAGLRLRDARRRVPGGPRHRGPGRVGGRTCAGRGCRTSAPAVGPGRGGAGPGEYHGCVAATVRPGDGGDPRWGAAAAADRPLDHRPRPGADPPPRSDARRGPAAQGPARGDVVADSRRRGDDGRGQLRAAVTRPGHAPGIRGRTGGRARAAGPPGPLAVYRVRNGLGVGAQRWVAVAALELAARAARARVVPARAGELVATGWTPAGLDARAAVFGRRRVAQPLGPAWPEPGRQAVSAGPLSRWLPCGWLPCWRGPPDRDVSDLALPRAWVPRAAALPRAGALRWRRSTAPALRPPGAGAAGRRTSWRGAAWGESRGPPGGGRQARRFRILQCYG